MPPSADSAPLPHASNRSGGGPAGGGSILRTHRLSLRHLTLDDAPFILTLLNDASWLRFIGDRNVHSLQDAQRYLKDGPFAMHAQHGYSLWAVTLADSDAAIGLCGLLKRDCLSHADVGYAFLPQWRGKGFAREAAAATLNYGRQVLGMKKILAVCSIDNDRSIRCAAVALLLLLPLQLTPATLQVAEQREHEGGGARAADGGCRGVQTIRVGAGRLKHNLTFFTYSTTTKQATRSKAPRGSWRQRARVVVLEHGSYGANSRAQSGC